MTQMPYFIQSILRPFVFLLVLAGTFIGLGGCNGKIKSTIVSQDMTAIRVEPTDAKSVKLNADECYWWLDDQGRLNIAGKGTKWNFLTGNKQEFAISFRLTEPSQGMGKDYSLHKSEIRGYIRTRGNVYRLQNVYGILGSENRKDGSIIAAYRCSVQLQGLGLFGGWSDPTLFLTFGKLEAYPDKEKIGVKIQAQIVDKYFGKPTTKPAKNNADNQADDFSIFCD